MFELHERYQYRSYAAFFLPYFPVPYHYVFLCFRVTGTPPSAAAITETANATVTLVTRDEIGIDIQHDYVDNDLITGQSAGDQVDCTIRISNEGTTTLSAVTIGTSLLDGQRARYEFVAVWVRDVGIVGIVSPPLAERSV